MADYLTIAVIHVLVGFELAFLGFLNMDETNDETVEALMIIGFLLFLSGAILTVLIKAGDLAGNKIATIVTLILVLAAGVLIIAGGAVWCDNNNNNCNEYTMTLSCSGGILGIIGGIFLIVIIAGGGGGSTSPA